MPWRAVAGRLDLALFLCGAFLLLAVAAMLTGGNGARVLAPAVLGAAALLTARLAFLAAKTDRPAPSLAALAGGETRQRSAGAAPADDKGSPTQITAAARETARRHGGEEQPAGAKPVTPASFAAGIEPSSANGMVPPPGGAAFERARFGLLAEEIGAGPADGLVEVFLGDTVERLAAMRSLIAAGERKTLARAAHSLKSAAATFGFERLAALAREIEGAAPQAPEPRLLALAEAAAEALEDGRRAWQADAP